MRCGRLLLLTSVDAAVADVSDCSPCSDWGRHHGGHHHRHPQHLLGSLVFWLLSSIALLMEYSALTRAVRTEKAFLHFQFDFEDFFNHLLTRNKITTTNKINWLYWQLTELMLYLKYRCWVELWYGGSLSKAFSECIMSLTEMEWR